MNFDIVKKAVSKKFSEIEKGNMFVVELDRDALWEVYLNSFDDLAERQEHNCNCCKHFIRNYGGVITIKDGKLSSIWEVTGVKGYQKAVDAMAAIVKSAQVSSIFVSKLAKLGTNHNLQRLDGGEVVQWDHFFHTLDRQNVTRSSDSEAAIAGNANSIRGVFKRSLDELTIDSVETVLDLISQNSLYRGQEFKKMLQDFLKHQKAYAKLEGDRAHQLYAWEHFKEGGKIRNTAIGTLLVDLSSDVDLEKAVRSFEAMVAPNNYQRPKALVTKKMIEDAEKKIKELGLEASLYRRHATHDDIPPYEMIFVNRNSAPQGNSLFDSLKADVPVNAKQFSRVEEIGIDDFVKNVVPNATSLEVLFEGKHVSNLMNLVAPVNIDTPSLFKWNNGLSWDYNGGMADSMKEKVKQHGGSVDGELRISLEWFNYDDLDLHVHEPGGFHIYFANKRSRSGYLDVDMNAGSGKSREAVENVIYTDKSRMDEGDYRIVVNNFNLRERVDVGFNVEIECNGEVFNFSYSDMVGGGKNIEVATIHYSKTNGVTIKKSIDATQNTRSKEIWGIDTNKFHKVSLLMNSPNHWDGAVGNKHTFFILEGCQNDQATRGFFNEFLKPELQAHKRLFEVLGSKMKVTEGEQLAGLGFSSTQKNSVIVKVEGKFNRTLKVNF